MFWGEGGFLEDLGDGGPAGDASVSSGAGEVFGSEGVAAVTWVLGGLGGGSEGARASGRRVVTDFLCLDLGEG